MKNNKVLERNLVAMKPKGEDRIKYQILIGNDPQKLNIFL